ncbi:Uncharacterised protein [Segatella copri]|nr:Uncharacterised protein [Segatella copri]
MLYSFLEKIVGACISKHSLLGKILFNILLQMGTCNHQYVLLQ